MFFIIAALFGIYNPILSIPALFVMFMGYGMLHNDRIYGAGLVAIVIGVVMFLQSANL